LAGRGALQLPASMAEAGVALRFREGARLVVESLDLRQVSVAPEVVVGLPDGLRIPRLRIPLSVSSVLSQLLAEVQTEG